MSDDYPFKTPLPSKQFGERAFSLGQTNGYKIVKPPFGGPVGPGEPMVLLDEKPNGYGRPHYVLLFPDGSLFHDGDSYGERDTKAQSLLWLREALIEHFELDPKSDSQDVFDTMVAKFEELKQPAKKGK